MNEHSKSLLSTSAMNGSVPSWISTACFRINSGVFSATSSMSMPPAGDAIMTGPLNSLQKICCYNRNCFWKGRYFTYPSGYKDRFPSWYPLILLSWHGGLECLLWGSALWSSCDSTFHQPDFEPPWDCSSRKVTLVSVAKETIKILPFRKYFYTRASFQFMGII